MRQEQHVFCFFTITSCTNIRIFLVCPDYVQYFKGKVPLAAFCNPSSAAPWVFFYILVVHISNQNTLRMKYLFFSVSFLCFSILFGLSAKAQHPPIDTVYKRMVDLYTKDIAEAGKACDTLAQYAEANDWWEGKIAVLDLLARKHRTLGNYDSAGQYISAGLQMMSNKWSTLDASQGRFTGAMHGSMAFQQAIISYFRGDYSQSLQLLDKADSLYDRYAERFSLGPEGYTAGRTALLGLKGNLYYTEGDLQKAAETFDQLSVLYEAEGNGYQLSIACLNAGTTYKEMGDLVKGIRSFTRGLEVAREGGYGRIEAVLIGAIGQLYYTMQEYPLALEYALQSYEASEAIDNRHGMAERAPDIGDLYKKLGKNDSALWYYEKGLALHTAMEQEDDMAYVLQRLGEMHLAMGAYERAMEAVEQGLVIALRNELFEEQLWLNLTKTSIFLARGQNREALATADLLLDLAGETDNITQKKDIYEEAYKAYAANGRMEQAFDYLLRYSNAKDSIYREEKNLAVAKAEYDLALENEKRLMAGQQEKQLLIHAQELARERWYLLTAIGSSVFLLVIVWISWQSYRRKRMANELLLAKNETIEAKNEELLAKNEELYALQERERENQQRERELLEENIIAKEKELAATAMVNHEKNMVLNTLNTKIEELSDKVADDLQEELKQLRKSVSAQINTEETWESFIHQFENIHPHFFDRLKAQFPELTITDLKLCAYIRVGMNNKEIAQASNLAVSSVKKSINRLKKKLGLGAEQSIRDFMLLSLH